MFVLANILQPLIDVNEAILKFWHGLGFSWGASIIFLTICIRLAILPLTFKQVRSMQEMQRFSPEINRIRERYKDDKQRQQEEMMKLYQEHGFNPLSSCLPLVLQLPFFFSLYQTLRSAGFRADVAAGGGGKFFFIPDITKPLTGHPVELAFMVVLYVATQLTSSYITSINIQDKNQRRIVFVLPFVFVPVIINFEAGLLIYWITTNLFTIFQQLAVRKFFPPPEPHVAPVGAAAAVSGGGTSRKRRGGGSKEPSEGGDGKPASGKAEAKPERKQKTKAQAGTSDGAGGNGGPRKAPPPSPRKKKKRTGRRR
jgi:YidC/Oxa1 family membrane protein insertase